MIVVRKEYDMQILKDDVKDNIIKSARTEFLEKGFSKASMRIIAEKSGITVGNIYRYFDGKESLYNEMIESAYEKIIELIRIDVDLELVEESDEYYMLLRDTIIGKILDIFDSYANELMIIQKKSSGTKYEDAFDNIVSAIHQQLQKYMLVSINRKGVSVDEKLFPILVTSSFLAGVTQILERYDNMGREIGRTNMTMIFDIMFYKIAQRLKECSDLK